MKMKLQSQLFTTVFSASVLFSTSINSASAITVNYSGRFGDNVSCVIEGSSSNRSCPFEGLAGGSFSGSLNLDESGARLNTAPPVLNLFDKAGNIFNQQIFINAGINFNNNVANLSFQTLDVSYEEELIASKEAPGITNITEPFGAFISGSYRKREGLAFRISQSINIVDAAVKPVQVPEGNFVLGIISCLGLSWLIKNVKTKA